LGRAAAGGRWGPREGAVAFPVRTPGMASRRPNGTILSPLASPGAAEKTAKATCRSLWRLFPGPQCRQSYGAGAAPRERLRRRAASPVRARRPGGARACSLLSFYSTIGSCPCVATGYSKFSTWKMHGITFTSYIF
jgi:hypothetical protein